METDIRVTAPPRPGRVAAALQAWKVGQLLKAVVVSGTPPAGGRAVLRIGSGEYAVRSQTPLQSGETLHLEVRRLQPSPLLQRAAPPSAGAGDAPAESALERSVKTLLARQTRLSAALQTLSQRLPQLPPAAARPLAELFAALPAPQELAQPARLRAALSAAGMPLEAALQRDAPPPAADLRRQIGQALAAWPADAHDLRPALEGMAARLTLNQLHGVRPPNAGGAQWFVELPLRTAQGFREARFEIETRPQGEGNGRAAAETRDDWAVAVQLDLPGLGPLEARLAARGGSVSAHFWAERADTAGRLDDALHELAAAWRDKGLRPGALHAHHGRAPARDAEPHGSGGLLDARA